MPVNGVVEVAGPEQFRLDGLVRMGLTARGDRREVIGDPSLRYFGALLQERSLLPGPDAQLATTRFQDWIAQSAVR